MKSGSRSMLGSPQWDWAIYFKIQCIFNYFKGNKLGNIMNIKQIWICLLFLHQDLFAFFGVDCDKCHLKIIFLLLLSKFLNNNICELKIF